MNAPLLQDWREANQARLEQAWARQLARLQGQVFDGPELLPMQPPSAIDSLVQAFELAAPERELLLLAAGVELQPELAAALPRLTVGDALRLVPGLSWDALGPGAPLRQWRLIELAGRGAPAGLRLDERVLHYLGGHNALDARLQPWLQPVAAPRLMAEAHRQLLAELLQALPAQQPQLLHLGGDDAPGRRDLAAALAQGLGLNLLALQADELPLTAGEQDDWATLWQREVLLLPAALLIEGDSTRESWGPELLRLVRRLPGLVMVSTRECGGLQDSQGLALQARVDRPDAKAQARLWQATGVSPAQAQELAAQYAFSAAQIGQLAQGDAAQLPTRCRQHGRSGLDALAQRITPQAGWSELVLPPAALGQLRAIAAQARGRARVHGDWGLGNARSQGLSALFCGDSGVGKTLACEVLAKELALDLYRIDLAGVVSKYIGETEKNLRRVFDRAEDSGALLLFDEADALFGKRSEVRDSHDRYANIEVSYLLQRLEAYRGLAVLTSNLRAAIDPAFLRRLRFVVQFPLPDAEQRERLWKLALRGPMPKRVLDYAQLAQLPLAGGAIQTIALNAAFAAAAQRRRLGMPQLAEAARQEFAKLERPAPEALLRAWKEAA